MAVNPTGSSSGANSASGAQVSDPLQDVNLSDFLTLLITELQNQDPLNPTDNSEMLQQLGQIREIAATDKLTNTLDIVSRSQQLSTASSLVGKEIRGLTDGAEAEFVTGVVSSVTYVDGTYKLNVGANQVDLKNVAEVKVAA